MSWIAGLLRFDGCPVTQAELAPMMGELKRRPHDRMQHWCEANAGLISAQLEVTPEDRFDQQPCTEATGRWHIVFDGRLDNRPALLQRLGSSSDQLPDSELALMAYQRWGRDCCHQLQGDYAFAVWDAQAGQLALFRDHIGLRPLFYTRTSQFFAFASHSALLRALPGVDTSLDEAWAADFICLSHHRAERTAYQGIHKLLGAQRLVVAAGADSAPERYWRLRDEWRSPPRYSRVESYYEEFFELLQTATAQRLRGTAPVATMLSGGLDSSALTALACQHLQPAGRELIAVSSVLADAQGGEASDERAYMQAMLRDYPAIGWRPVTASGQNMFSEIDTLLSVCDQPSRDIFYFMTCSLMREGQATGARSMLTGFGGDMFVSTKLNEALLDMLWRGRLFMALKICAQEADAQKIGLSRALRNAFSSSLRVKLVRLWERWRVQARVRAETLAVFDEAFSERTGVQQQLTEHFRALTPGFFSARAYDEVLLASGVMDEGLTSLALMGKAAAMDVVMPLLDKTLIAYCINLPLWVRRHGGLQRSLLRNTCQPVLPAEIFERTSKGAFVPDQTNRLYAAVAEELPRYQKADKSMPPWLNLQAISQAAEQMQQSGTGFSQQTDLLTSTVTPLLMAEFCSRRWN